MRKTITVSALVLALAASTYAGEMGYPIASPQPAPTPAATQTATEAESSDGNMGYPVADAATEVALNLLQTLLALF